MAKMKKLEDLFHDTLKDVYYAEKKILGSLPKMAKAAQHAGLKAAFEKHLGETEGQIDRLDQVFAEIDKKPQSKTCDAIVGITKEGQEIAAKNSYRPRDQEIARKYKTSFAKVELFTIDELFGGWTKAQKEHFGDGGTFDQIYK